MTYHILNGDALKAQFPAQILGETIIFRECLIDGPISANSLDEFWLFREGYITEAFGSDEDYSQKVLSEFDKMQSIKEKSEVNLWFDEDLYCLMNLCFTIHLIHSNTNSVSFYWIRPTTINNWWGFGGMSPEELSEAYDDKILLEGTIITSLNQMWGAFQQKDFDRLASLADELNHIFPRIKDVVKAHIERFSARGKLGRPEMAIYHEVQAHPDWNFGQVFRAFIEKEGIYGFGDLQVKRMYDKVQRFREFE